MRLVPDRRARGPCSPRPPRGNRVPEARLGMRPPAQTRGCPEPAGAAAPHPRSVRPGGRAPAVCGDGADGQAQGLSSVRVFPLSPSRAFKSTQVGRGPAGPFGEHARLGGPRDGGSWASGSAAPPRPPQKPWVRDRNTCASVLLKLV